MVKKIGLGVIAFGLITTLFAACGIIDTSTMSSGPAVHMGATNFLQSSITMKKGDPLRLIDNASDQHIITNGTWQGTTAKPGKEPSAPPVNVSINGVNSSATIGPFTTAGTFQLYCTIHQGMNLTVIVQ
jgi:plastocyanin